jgi:hypothetical protein
MKGIAIVFLLLPLFIDAQDSTAAVCNLIRDTDPYTKEVKLSSGFMSLQGATLTIDADSKEIDFFFVIENKCYEDESTVSIFFEGNKAKTTYRNTGSMNCNGYFHFIFRNGLSTPTVLQKMATQPVAHFIFTGNDKKAVTVDLLPDQQKTLMNITTCLIAESKTLLKK